MAIEEGDLALLYAPPRDHTSTQSKAQQEWIRKHWSCRPSDSRAMLEYSVAAFTAKYSNVQRSEWLPAIEKEILRDVSSMQRHPAIRTDHRRYVVLRNEPKTSRNSYRLDGVSFNILPLTHTDCTRSWSGLRRPCLILEMISSRSKHD